MAKLSSVNKNERRKKLVAKYANRYAKLKAQANDKSADETERLIARLKMAEIPRNGNPTRIRNGQRARKDSVLSPASKLRVRVLDVLQREGYIRGYSEEEMGPAKGIRIELKYFEGQPAIKHVARISKPGRRVYSGSQELPRVMNGLGITIVSTPRGVLSDAEAREQNVGGEVLAEVF